MLLNRSERLGLNINTNIIKEIVNNFISDFRDRLLKVNYEALFFYLYNCLRILKYDTSEYKTNIHIISRFKHLYFTVKTETSEDLLIQMMEQYRDIIDDL